MLPTQSSPKAAQVVHHHGKGFAAKVPGVKESVPLDHSGVAVHLDTGTQFDPGGGQPMVNLHQAFHGKALPPALMKLIAQAVEQYLALHDVHDFAGSDQAMPGLAPDESAPPDDLAGAGGGGLPIGMAA